MIPEVKDNIVEFIRTNPNSSTRAISETIDWEILETYNALCMLEQRGVVQRGSNITGTITFIWKLLD